MRDRVKDFGHAVIGELSMCGPAAIFEKLVSNEFNIHFLSQIY